MRSTEESKVFVEASLNRMRVPVAQVPFAKHSGGIASRLKALCDGGLLDSKIVRRRRARIEFVPEPLLIAAAHQAGSRRTAIGAAHIAIGKPDSVRRDRIDMRRRDFL